MTLHIAAITLVVPDYDEAIAFYVGTLGFALVEDTALSPQKRWVRVAPPGRADTCLILAKAATDAQRARIGDQTGGRVFLFLATDDFERDHAALATRGVRFIEAPRSESYGRVVVFADPFGNRWDLVERRA